MGAEQWREAEDVRRAEDLVRAQAAIRAEIGRVIVGQERVVEELLTSLFTSGHCLLIGVPGLAKTLLVSTLARALHLSFNRVQFTPDLMPSDITGTEVLEEDAERRRFFRFLKGPIQIFAKAPLPGLTKSRLIPALGTEGAAHLKAHFIRHTLATTVRLRLPTELWCTPDKNQSGVHCRCP